MPKAGKAATPPQFLVHAAGDSVAVAVTEIAPGQARGTVLATDIDVSCQVIEAIPLGHKIALVDIGNGDPVIEYGVQIGVATRAIACGQLVHTHNLRSARWQTSVAD